MLHTRASAETLDDKRNVLGLIFHTGDSGADHAPAMFEVAFNVVVDRFIAVNLELGGFCPQLFVYTGVYGAVAEGLDSGYKLMRREIQYIFVETTFECGLGDGWLDHALCFELHTGVDLRVNALVLTRNRR